MSTATWNGETLAASEDVVVVEGNRYFPRDAVDDAYLEPSDHTSECPWKGTATYFHVVAGGKRNENAAWTYEEPKPAAQEIAGRIAFWRGVEVSA